MLRSKLLSVGPLCAVLVIMSLSGLAQIERRVIYSFPGNTLIAFGGDKVIDADLFLESFIPLPEDDLVPIGDPDLAFLVREKTWSGFDAVRYGNGQVITQFNSTVRYNPAAIPHWAVVRGRASTRWTGTQPQFFSSRIRLESSWTFHGLVVYISYPPGFSGFATTVTWSGEDNSGRAWMLTHIYSGIYGEGWFGLWFVDQSTNGSHYFERTFTWVSANARGRVNVMF